jgi:hypothetical protein
MSRLCCGKRCSQGLTEEEKKGKVGEDEQNSGNINPMGIEGEMEKISEYTPKGCNKKQPKFKVESSTSIKLEIPDPESLEEGSEKKRTASTEEVIFKLKKSK